MSVGDYKYFTVTHRQFKQAGDYFIKVLESLLVVNKYLKHLNQHQMKQAHQLTCQYLILYLRFIHYNA